MKSYGQYCSVARALDVVGDRWTLLIVRELLTQGPCRYTDLRAGLPGIASNLLSARLKELEAAGLISRTAAPPPIATTLFELTDRGRALKDVLYALGRWGVDLMVTADGSDAFRSNWFTFATENFLSDTDPDAPDVTIGLDAGEAPVHIVVGHGQVELRKGIRACPGPHPGRRAPPHHGRARGQAHPERRPLRRPVGHRRPRRPRPRRPPPAQLTQRRPE